ncbi:MAG: alpha/beta fold hydrolase [Actinomycetota bacterium]
MSLKYRVGGVDLIEHEFSVPLDHSRPHSELITLFVREVAAFDGRDRPYLVFFQGGPGSEAPRPTRNPNGPGWLDRALEDFRVLLLDQRGTGRSSPVGSLPGMDPQAQAEHLTHFRADSIVRDAEYIRSEMDVDRWSILGQSFGGFCATTYLSIAPGGLREAFITGGVPPVERHVDDVYRATYDRVRDRTRRFYERYPEDRRRVVDLHRHLEDEDVRLPSGDRLTWRRFRQVGSALGMSDGAEHLHYLLELPFDSPAFLHDVETGTMFARDPLYAVVHEACYADGYATRWSAERVMPDEFKSPETFTGEHVYPWMFDDYGALGPLREAAHLLADHAWAPLYDTDQLRANEVPSAAAIYVNDMYVERQFSEETASLIPNLRPWITNEYEHNALRIDGGRVLDRLIDLARERI